MARCGGLWWVGLVTFKRAMTAAMAVTIVVFTTAVGAAKGGDVRAGKPTPALRANAEQHLKAFLNAESKRRSVAMKDIEQAFAAGFEAARKDAQRHPEFEAFRKDFDRITNTPNQARSYDEARTLLAKQSQALEGLAKKYQTLLDSAAKATRLDHKRTHGVVQKITPSGNQPTFPDGPALSWTETSAPEQPQPSTFRLERPYTDRLVEQHRAGVSFNGANTDPDDGTTSVWGWVLTAGQSHNMPVVGSAITVPAGYSQLQVTTRVDIDVKVFSQAFLALARAEAYVFILLVDDADFRRQHQHTIVSSFSLIVGLSSEHIVRDVTVDKTFDIPEEGGDYLVMVGVYGYSGAGGIEAFASARGEGTTEYIAVEALP